MQAPRDGNIERRGDQRKNGDANQVVQQGLIDQGDADGDRSHDEGELSHLPQQQARKEGFVPPSAEQTQRQNVEKRLEQRRANENRDDNDKVVEKKLQIDKKPDRKKKDHQQDNLDRLGILVRNMTLRAVADRQAGKERPEGRRKPQHTADQREGEAPSQHGERRQVALRHDQIGKRHVEGLLPRQQHDDSDQHRDGKGHLQGNLRQTARIGHAAVAEARDDQQHRRDRQVLGDQNADDKLAGARVALADALDNRDRDGGRRDREAEGEQQNLSERESEVGSQPQREQKTRDDLQRGRSDRRLPNLSEALQRKLDANEIQQHDDADLGERLDALCAAGCDVLYLHARKAWLRGVSAKENRNLPPLKPEVARRLQQARPSLPVVYNGGIQDIAEAERCLAPFAGVMVGRALWRSPCAFACKTEAARPLWRKEIADRLLSAIEKALSFSCASAGSSDSSDSSGKSFRFSSGISSRLSRRLAFKGAARLSRRAMSLYHGTPEAGYWRRGLQRAFESSKVVEKAELDFFSQRGYNQADGGSVR